MVQLDLRLTRICTLERSANSEQRFGKNVEVSLDAFNAFNHTNVIAIVGVVTSPLFGQADSANPARTLQFSAKYNF